jgi:hypothetical protein
MTKEHPFVVVESKALPFGAMEFNFRLEGPAGAPVSINRRIIKLLTGEMPIQFPSKLDMRGIPLRLVGGSERVLFVSDAALYVRADGYRIFAWRLSDALARIRRPLRWVNIRLILTLYVWGMADVRPGEIISWRCVRKSQGKN